MLIMYHFIFILCLFIYICHSKIVQILYFINTYHVIMMWPNYIIALKNFVKLIILKFMRIKNDSYLLFGKIY